MPVGTVEALLVAGTYVGTVVGAGFASGQEILRFFGLLGGAGWWGLLLAAALFALFGARILLLGRESRAASYWPVLLAAAGPVLARPLDYLIVFFLFGSAVTMVAAAGAAGQEAWGWPPLAGSGAMAVAATGTVLLGLRGVTRSISLVSPLLIAAIVALAWAVHLRGGQADGPGAALPPVVPFWPLAAVLYVSFNLVGAIGVLAPLGGSAARRWSLLAGAALGALGLGLAAASVLSVLHSDLSSLQRAQVPLVRAAGDLAPWAGGAYSAVLLLEVYTTAVASLFGLTSRLDRLLPRGPTRGALLVGATLLASRVGFARLVATLYPLVGAAGLLLLACLAFPRARRHCH